MKVAIPRNVRHTSSDRNGRTRRSASRPTETKSPEIAGILRRRESEARRAESRATRVETRRDIFDARVVAPGASSTPEKLA